tara:strand:+ start:35 stop:220 length:186 start_codon:yes stop_codon:yes gene_type:complete
METLTKYQQFQNWLDSCPVTIEDYQDFTDKFQITFNVPLEERVTKYTDDLFIDINQTGGKY